VHKKGENLYAKLTTKSTGKNQFVSVTAALEFLSQHLAKGATRSACKPCRELPLYFFVRDALASVKLIESFLDRLQEFNAFGNLIQRGIVRQLMDRIEH
jgi:hypothetical protein